MRWIVFGYVQANRKILKPEGIKDYQSFYCGLCRELKNIGGAKAQVLLNFDCTFLAILLSGLYEDELPLGEEFICAVHPGRKKYAVSNEFISYAAAMDIILSYHNLLDDYNDQGNIAKKTAANMLRKTYNAVQEKYPRQVKAVEEALEKLAKAEAAGEENLDIVAGFTGEMLAEIFAYHDKDIWNQDLRNLGFYLGKFIYLMDAYEDREKDEKKGSYNPLSALYKSCEKPNDYEIFVQQTLSIQMEEVAKSFERLPIIDHAEVIRNILYSGVWTKYEVIQIKSGRRKEEMQQAGKIPSKAKEKNRAGKRRSRKKAAIK